MRIKLAPTNLAILEKLNQDYKIPVTSLANSCIYEKLGDKIKLLKEFDISLANDETELKIRIFETEKDYLLKSSEITGTNSLTQEIRYRVLNSIYEKKLLIPIEIKVLNEIKYEINRIGRNLHQILKYLNFKEELKSDDLKELIAQLNMKLDENKKILENHLNYTNNRFNTTK